ncbi:MAG: sugar-binding protein [Acetanaerobacterium sp.]
MKMKFVKTLAATLLASSFLVCQVSADYDYSTNADKDNFVPYVGNYDAAANPQKNLDALFTTDAITVDGVMDDAYASSTSAIENLKPQGDYSYADGASPGGNIHAVWNGPVLFLLVEVHDTTAVRGTLPDEGGALADSPATPTDRDSVQFGLDFYNDKVMNETDTAGMFTISSNGALYFYRNAGIPSLGSVMADPIHPEYTNFIESYAAQDVYDADGKTVIGYNVEVAINVEKALPENDTTFGVDAQISDVAAVGGEVKRVGEVDWSHNQDSLYTDYDGSRPISVDWGNVKLAGWNGTDTFAFSNWRLTNNIRYLDSIAFPKGVYTPATQAALDEARSEADALVSAGNADKATVDAAADTLDAAIAGLRWADTTYPDPADLPDQFTLPNPYQFFGSDQVVQSNEDWEKRSAEILDMAQFYEYGYKPGAPDKSEITKIVHINAGDQLYWYTRDGVDYFQDATIDQEEVTLEITVGQTTAELVYTVYLPTEEQLQSSGHTTGPVPVVLSFDGDKPELRDAGFVVVKVPKGSGGDGRSNEYAWGTRTGAFYELYPYSRNGEEALTEVSSEMAAAWSCTRVIDALETMGASQVAGAADIAAALDPSKLAVSGFSINGKYAFVSAVFDSRISVCIPGAAGASGPSPWRYVYVGHEYDWTGTPFAPAAITEKPALQISTGTEYLANSIRHNRVRETELFRHFLTPGNFYQRLPGAYGYATRLPYDQDDLIATLAPRAIVLVNTVNDYNDGSEADSLGLQVAKSVYNTLGYDADDLVKFNQRPVQGPGDPHGTDPVQTARTGEYLNHYFYDTEMSADTDTWLNNDPFNMKVSNNNTQTPFDHYYGGFNTITGGTGGITGNDGWYYYSFPDATDNTANTDSTGDTDNTEDAGNSGPAIFFVIAGLLIVIIAAAFFIIKKKKKN